MQQERRSAYALLPSGRVRETKRLELIGKVMAAEGEREEFIKILLEGVSEMPGCLSQ